MKSVFSKAIFGLMLAIPIIAFVSITLSDFTYWKHNLINDKIAEVFLIMLPMPAIYFLLQKNKYYKFYGGLVCVYIFYHIYTFLKQTSGAL